MMHFDYLLEIRRRLELGHIEVPVPCAQHESHLEFEFQFKPLIIKSTPRLYLQSGTPNLQLLYNPLQLGRVGLAQTVLRGKKSGSPAGPCQIKH
jgi:hypothetical protein